MLASGLANPQKKVLDVGCGEFPFKNWRKKGFKCWGVDFHSWSKDPYFRKEDIRHMSFPNEFFDVVYSISTLEHVGIRRYGDKKDVRSGDRKAVLEMARVLKRKGIMVVTLPCGHPVNWVKKHRIYDVARVKKLFSGFKIVKWEYWIRGKKGWQRSNIREILAYTEGKRKWLGNVNVVVKKP